MAEKLSKTTLSLRFMQNANRAKQMQEVQPDKADIKDDGEWQVSQAVKDSWGISDAKAESYITYEASYLPFVFSSGSSSGMPESSQEESFTQPKGRRVFKKGKEVIETVTTSADMPLDPPAPISKDVYVKPKSISLSKSMKSKSTSSTGPSKTAREVIFDTSGTGIDLHAKTTPVVQPTPQLLSNTFLKPAGVDDPPKLSKAPSLEPKGSNQAANHSLDSSHKNKRNREADHDSEQAGDVSKTRKKKRKSRANQ